MPQTITKPVLLTGASGALGRVLASAMSKLGWTVRMTDIVPFPGPLPPGTSFIRADLEDGVAMLRMAEGCGAIVHFGGTSTDQPFEAVIGPNIRGLYHIYEAARREHARVVFASSNHAIGFHERSEVLDSDCALRPDTYYGLSKAYGELMGRLYWDKHAVESVSIRIGSSLPEPVDARMLASWLSYDDVARATVASVTASDIGCLVIWGASDNSRMAWWRHDGRATIGWTPQDSADRWIDALEGKTSGNPVTERYQGGAYCASEYSRQ